MKTRCEATLWDSNHENSGIRRAVGSCQAQAVRMVPCAPVVKDTACRMVPMCETCAKAYESRWMPSC